MADDDWNVNLLSFTIIKKVNAVIFELCNILISIMSCFSLQETLESILFIADFSFENKEFQHVSIRSREKINKKQVQITEIENVLIMNGIIINELRS